MKLELALLIGLSLLASGCNPSEQSGYQTPSISSSSAASQALEAYDTSGDDLLDKDELQACPALLANLSKYDADGDGHISKEELVARFDNLFPRGAELTNITCTITDGRRPVVGAEVRFVPEAFLGGKLLTATGVTDSTGVAKMAIADSDLPEKVKGNSVAQIGIYRVEVDAKQGTKTFGHEVDFTDRSGTDPTFDLRDAK